MIRVDLTPIPPATDDEPTAWLATVNGTPIPVTGFAVDVDPTTGQQVLSLVLTPDEVHITPTPAVVEPAPPRMKRAWGVPVPDPREGLPGWAPEVTA